MKQYKMRSNINNLNFITIYENDAVQYQFFRSSRFFLRTDFLRLEDRFGDLLIRIDRGHESFLRPTFELFSVDGRRLATVRRKFFFRTDLEIDTYDGPYRIEEWHRKKVGYYSLWDAQNLMVARQGIITEVAEDQNQAFVLALMSLLSLALGLPPVLRSERRR